MKTLLKIFIAAVVLFVGSAFIAAAYQTFTKEPVAYRVLSVSDFPYTMRDKQAVLINIGKTKEDFFSVTVHRDKIKQGTAIVRDTTAEDYAINADTTKNTKPYFFMRGKGLGSVISLSVDKLDQEKKEAKITVYLKLHHHTGKAATLDKQTFTISGDKYDKLTKSI